MHGLVYILDVQFTKTGASVSFTLKLSSLIIILIKKNSPAANVSALTTQNWKRICAERSKRVKSCKFMREQTIVLINSSPAQLSTRAVII